MCEAVIGSRCRDRKDRSGYCDFSQDLTTSPDAASRNVATGKTAQGIATSRLASGVSGGGYLRRDRKDRSGYCDFWAARLRLGDTATVVATGKTAQGIATRRCRPRTNGSFCWGVATGKTAQGIATQDLPGRGREDTLKPGRDRKDRSGYCDSLYRRRHFPDREVVATGKTAQGIATPGGRRLLLLARNSSSRPERPLRVLRRRSGQILSRWTA